MSGFGFWAHDIGGFENTSTADVYKRWVAFGLLSSHSRLHGSTSYRVPWVYDEEAGIPEEGIAPGTKFEDLPEDFVCPLCGVGKDQFAEE